MPGMYQIIRNEDIPSLPSLFLRFIQLNKIQMCNELFIIGGVVAGNLNHRHSDSGTNTGGLRLYYGNQPLARLKIIQKAIQFH